VPDEIDTLRKVLVEVLTPYGFRSRNDNGGHGSSPGTAVLSAPRRINARHTLLEMGVERGESLATRLSCERITGLPAVVLEALLRQRWRNC
jgi:hypothetical protein